MNGLLNKLWLFSRREKPLKWFGGIEMPDILRKNYISITGQYSRPHIPKEGVAGGLTITPYA